MLPAEIAQKMIDITEYALVTISALKCGSIPSIVVVALYCHRLLIARRMSFVLKRGGGERGFCNAAIHSGVIA